MKNFVLLAIILAIGFFIYKQYKKIQIQHADDTLILIESNIDSINNIEIYGDHHLLFIKEDNHWVISNDTLNIQCKAQSIQQLLHALKKVESDQIIKDHSLISGSTIKKTKVKIHSSNEEESHSFLIWPSEDEGASYFQWEKDQNAFLLNKNIAYKINQPFQHYRNEYLIAPLYTLSPDSIVYINDSVHYEFKKDSLWQAAFLKDEVSEFIEGWINSIKHLHSNQFASLFDPTNTHSIPTQEIKLLEGKHIIADLNCYRDSTLKNQFFIHSLHNEGNWFVSDSTGIYKDIFINFHEIWHDK